MPINLTQSFIKLLKPSEKQIAFVQGSLQKIQNKVRNILIEAAPATRNFDITAVTLYRIADNALVGSFVPELYEMAKAGKLQCQWEEAQWAAGQAHVKDSPDYIQTLRQDNAVLFNKLFTPIPKAPNQHRRKTAFELAVAPSKDKAFITRFYKAEYKFAREQGFALPAFISKLRVEADYLQNLANAGLRVGVAKGFKVNIDKKENKVTTREAILHLTMQGVSILATLTAGLALVGPNPNLLLFAAIMGSTWLARKYGNDFGYYDVAEGTNRDLGWFFSRDSWKGKFSLGNFLKTVLLLGALGGAMYMGLPKVNTEILELPIWNWMSALGSVNPQTLQAVSKAIAGFLTTAATLQLWTSISFSQRFFLGLSIWNNQIDFNETMGAALPEVNDNTKLNELMDLELKLARRGPHAEDVVRLIEEHRTAITIAREHGLQMPPAPAVAQVEPVVPVAQGEPVVPTAQDEPVVPAAQVEPVVPAAQVEPVVPGPQQGTVRRRQHRAGGPVEFPQQEPQPEPQPEPEVRRGNRERRKSQRFGFN